MKAKNGRPCTICQDAKLKAIDLALASGQPAPAVAEGFGVSVRAIQRHRAGHLRPGLVRVAADREDSSPNAILDRMAALQTKTLSLLERAELEKAKPADLARIIRECRENELTLARLTGLLREGSVTNIDNRRQIVNISKLSDEDLRALAASARADLPAAN